MKKKIKSEMRGFDLDVPEPPKFSSVKKRIGFFDLSWPLRFLMLFVTYLVFSLIYFIIWGKLIP
jgi:hypothetical protein